MAENSAETHRRSAPQTVTFSVLTVSDSRTLTNDTSGDLIIAGLEAAGHQIVSRAIVPDELDTIRNAVGAILGGGDADTLLAGADAILVTGGTGITSRDRTPEAIRPMLDAEILGFGELFRMLSYQEIGPAAMLSRAFAGRIEKRLIFCLPGSSNAVKLAIEKLIVPELAHMVFHAQN